MSNKASYCDRCGQPVLTESTIRIAVSVPVKYDEEGESWSWTEWEVDLCLACASRGTTLDALAESCADFPDLAPPAPPAEAP